SPLALVSHAAGGGCRGEVPVVIQSDGADRSVGWNEIRHPRAPLLTFELLDSFGGAERRIRHQIHALLQRKFLRARTHEQHVARLLHHAPSEIDGVSDMTDASHSASALCAPLHDGRIELCRAVASQSCSAAGVEQRVVLEDTYCSRDGIEARAAGLQYLVTGVHGRLQTRSEFPVSRGGQGLCRNGTGA